MEDPQITPASLKRYYMALVSAYTFLHPESSPKKNPAGSAEMKPAGIKSSGIAIKRTSAAEIKERIDQLRLKLELTEPTDESEKETLRKLEHRLDLLNLRVDDIRI